MTASCLLILRRHCNAWSTPLQRQRRPLASQSAWWRQSWCTSLKLANPKVHHTSPTMAPSQVYYKRKIQNVNANTIAWQAEKLISLNKNETYLNKSYPYPKTQHVGTICTSNHIQILSLNHILKWLQFTFLISTMCTCKASKHLNTTFRISLF